MAKYRIREKSIGFWDDEYEIQKRTNNWFFNRWEAVFTTSFAFEAVEVRNRLIQADKKAEKEQNK